MLEHNLEEPTIGCILSITASYPAQMEPEMFTLLFFICKKKSTPLYLAAMPLLFQLESLDDWTGLLDIIQ